MLYAYCYRPAKRKNVRSPKTRVVSSALLIAGLFLIGMVAYPIISWQVGYWLVSPNLLSPTPQSAPKILGAAVSAFDNKNYNKVSSWFDGARVQPSDPNRVRLSYTISVPKLKIDRALVEHGGEDSDLRNSLIAWPTSVDPGSDGEAIIFGHSALPSFYNPRSYSTIFTKIYDLDYGDGLYVDFDGIRYVYKVESKKVIPPSDLAILEQRYDRPRIVMITCLPAGTTLLRGVVTATLSPSGT